MCEVDGADFVIDLGVIVRRRERGKVVGALGHRSSGM